MWLWDKPCHSSVLCSGFSARISQSRTDSSPVLKHKGLDATRIIRILRKRMMFSPPPPPAFSDMILMDEFGGNLSWILFDLWSLYRLRFPELKPKTQEALLWVTMMAGLGLTRTVWFPSCIALLIKYALLELFTVTINIYHGSTQDFHIFPWRSVHASVPSPQTSIAAVSLSRYIVCGKMQLSPF